MEAKMSWLGNPEVFEVNREEAHSDHKWYASTEKKEGDFFQSLNGTWYFSYAPTVEEREQDFYKEGFDYKHFDTIEVPSHIQLQGYDRCQYVNVMYPWDGKEGLVAPEIPKDNPTGSYIRSFTVKEELLQKRLFLSFKGVEQAFFVWVNGTFIGYAEDSFTPSDFEITDAIKEGENVVAVQVFKRSSAAWIEDQDFWRFSGIFRDVMLYAIPNTHVWDMEVKATPSTDYKTAVVGVKGTVFGDTTCQIKASLYNKQGELVVKQEIQNTDEHFDMTLSLEKEVHLWSAEIPYLYELQLEILDRNGTLIEWIPYKVGIRRLEMIDGVMCINGKRFVFHGVNRHEFHPRKGRAITEEEMIYDIRCLKRNNMNAVRTCHYPNQTRWYELCDEYGIYVIDEANLESHGSWQKLSKFDEEDIVPGNKKEWKECVVDRAKSMYQRDKNHPSIVMWSCGNESHAGTCIEAMSDYFHEQDKERFVHYEGVFHNRKFDHISDMESRMYARPKDIEEYLKMSPKKPYISCEYMHAMGNSIGGMELYSALEEQYDQYQGGFIWDYIDQAIWQDRDGKEVLAYGGDFDDRFSDYGFCTNGIVYADRKESPKMQEVKFLYSNIAITFENNDIHIRNKNAFLGTDGYRFVFTLEKEGNVVERLEKTFSIVAGETLVVQSPFATPTKGGEYVLQVSVQLAKDELYEKEGYEIAFGQTVFQIEEKESQIEHVPFKIVEGDGHIGAYGEGFSALFSRIEGGIVSLIYDGVEYITRTPKVTFWRASVDNDRGRGDQCFLGQWLTATLCQRYEGEKFYIEKGEQEVTLHFFYFTASVPKIEFEVIYCMRATGELEVEVRYPGVDGMPDMPAFGMEWKLKKENDTFRFYGMGPEENYVDRHQGARLGVYEKAVQDNVSEYLVPQECGNYTGVRYVEIFGQKNADCGICFKMLDTPFESSVLPYSAMELEHALHLDELPKSHHTYVRILAKQIGVGGDDTWGAPVHNRYKWDPKDAMTLKFVVCKK